MGINTNLKVPYILLICRTLYITFMMGCLIFTGHTVVYLFVKHKILWIDDKFAS